MDELQQILVLSSKDGLELFLMLFDDVQKTNCVLSLPKNKKYEYCMDLLGRRSRPCIEIPITSCSFVYDLYEVMNYEFGYDLHEYHLSVNY